MQEHVLRLGEQLVVCLVSCLVSYNRKFSRKNVDLKKKIKNLRKGILHQTSIMPFSSPCLSIPIGPAPRLMKSSVSQSPASLPESDKLSVSELLPISIMTYKNKKVVSPREDGWNGTDFFSHSISLFSVASLQLSFSF